MTLKQTIYNILLNNPECRNSDKKLQWEVLDNLGLIDPLGLSYQGFMKAPEFESIRRCRQALQRTDKLTGKNLIQPTEEVKKKRVKLSKEKGYSYMQGQFNPETMQYEIRS